MIMDDLIAVVTGANRGIGFEVCRQMARRGVRVVLTARNPALGREAVDALEREGLTVDLNPLDVNNDLSVRTLKEDLESRFGRLDILVNNAGAGAKGDTSALEVEAETVRRAIEVNCLGALLVTQGLLPLLQNSRGARIINVSSGMGALSTMKGGLAAYRISKTCLNSLSAIMAHELEGRAITVNAVCPGWVRTRMGGADAPLSVAEGADTIVWLALDAPPSLSGKFVRARQVIAW
jgi:NAD(P)-dependent dehydrogenase (short-subunit alcohol dehydrogenase family)